jgi:hypothetical protein
MTHSKCTESLTAVCTLCDRFKVYPLDHDTDRTVGVCKEKYFQSNHVWNWVDK